MKNHTSFSHIIYIHIHVKTKRNDDEEKSNKFKYKPTTGVTTKLNKFDSQIKDLVLQHDQIIRNLLSQKNSIAYSIDAPEETVVAVMKMINREEGLDLANSNSHLKDIYVRYNLDQYYMQKCFPRIDITNVRDFWKSKLVELNENKRGQ